MADDAFDAWESLQGELYTHDDEDDEIVSSIEVSDEDSSLGKVVDPPTAKGPRTGARAMHNHERRMVGLTLRRQGMTWKGIAEQAGYASAETARSSVLGAMKELELEGARELRTLQHLRLEHLLSKHWSKAESGNVRSGMFVLNVMDRINKLWGLEDYRRLAAEEAQAEVEDEGVIVIGGGESDFVSAAQKMIEARDGTDG